MFCFKLEVPTLYNEDGEVLLPERLEVYRCAEPPRLGTVVRSNGTKYWVEKVHYFKSKNVTESGPIGLITLMDEEAWQAVQCELADARLAQSKRDLCIGLAVAVIVITIALLAS